MSKKKTKLISSKECRHKIDMIYGGGGDSNQIPICKYCGEIFFETETPATKLHSFNELLRHKGHEITCVTYGKNQNVSLECKTCNEVLLSYDNPKFN